METSGPPGWAGRDGRTVWDPGITVTVVVVWWVTRPGRTPARVTPCALVPACFPLDTASAPPAAGMVVDRPPGERRPWPGLAGGASGRGSGWPASACEGAAEPWNSWLSDPLNRA